MKTKSSGNLIFEIGTEEIPARFVPEMLADLKQKAEKEFAAQALSYVTCQTFGTPRRLVLNVENLADRQPDENISAKGPPKDLAFDQSGNPTKAAEGFAHKSGVSVAALQVKAVDGRDYVFAEYLKKGETTEKLLPDILPKLIASLYLPISMRWGSEDFKFIRPIHWILASFCGKLVKFELAGVKTALSISGHRFLAGGKMQKVPAPALRGMEAYKTFLRGVGVVLDQEERKAIITEGVNNCVTEENTKPLLDPALLDEVTYLVEYPDFLLGSFPHAFLKVPNEVLVTSMKKNQKYFPILDERGHLTNKFVIVTNCKVGANQKTLREGNERVIAARLSDARYFFDEDQKIKLEARVPDLAKIAFHEGLGNLLEKKDRLVELTRNLGHLFGLDEHTVARAARVAHLCKADLTTQMVFEFTELQGIMGREYALLSGEEKSVAQGIFEHYLPRFAGDILPKTPEGVLVSLADKFDSLIGCFSLGVMPTGSHDPFGLRRLAMGIVAIVMERKLDFILEDLVRKNYKLYLKIHKNAQDDKRKVLPEEAVLEKLLQFLAERMKNIFKEEGIRYDLAEAALHEFNDIWAAQKTARALQRHAQAPWFKGLVESADRIHRLAASATRENVLEHDFISDAEKQMFEAYLKVNWEVGEKIKKGEFEAALLELAKFTPFVEKFFVDVLVMHEDEKVKTNRLALLKTLEKMYFEFADFSKIVIGTATT